MVERVQRQYRAADSKSPETGKWQIGATMSLRLRLEVHLVRRPRLESPSGPPAISHVSCSGLIGFICPCGCSAEPSPPVEVPGERDNAKGVRQAGRHGLGDKTQQIGLSLRRLSTAPFRERESFNGLEIEAGRMVSDGAGNNGTMVQITA